MVKKKNANKHTEKPHMKDGDEFSSTSTRWRESQESAMKVLCFGGGWPRRYNWCAKTYMQKTPLRISDEGGKHLKFGRTPRGQASRPVQIIQGEWVLIYINIQTDKLVILILKQAPHVTILVEAASIVAVKQANIMFHTILATASSLRH